MKLLSEVGFLKRISNAVFLGLVLLIVTPICLGWVLQQPLLFSYTNSDSMDPTIGMGDLFIIVPKPLFTPYTGDIVVFKSPSYGTYLAHRIVGEGPKGFVTKGDNSPFTDQQAGESFVKEDMIVGKVLTVWNRPILVPKAGLFIQSLSRWVRASPLAFAVGFGVLGVATLVLGRGGNRVKKRKKKRSKRRNRIRFKHLYFASSTVFILACSLLMLLGSNQFQIEYLVFDDGTTSEEALAGGSFERELILENNGWLPYFVVLKPKSDNIISKQQVYSVSPKETKHAELMIKTQKQMGWHTENLEAWKYLPFLPSSLLGPLSKYSPLIPMLTIDLEMLTIISVIYALTGGGNEPVTPRIGWSKWLKRSLRRMTP